ncbi:MAG: BatA domain-containing protein [Chitinophagales bacterium]|nr:BatA domain-containing protein [Chitinophagales bacterium]MCB9020812.1 BatA domain-containing protein [Chitinophagales bacterium]HQU76330.1 BatA domain-containing protein [Chitinophagales bacterium]HRX24392.1 BatA domain-containing protein [Chitinophagales bacterium]
MSFLAPGMLWGLLLLAVPVIIHLFSFRRFKTVYFPDIRFLKQVREESATRNRLKQWLILAARMLAVFFLVMAFAQPFLPGAEKAVTGSSHAVSVYVDNSFSMEAEHDGLSLLEAARQQARAVVNAYGLDDRFQILSNTPDALSQQWLSKEEALDVIGLIETGPEVQTISEVTVQQFNMLRRAGDAEPAAFLISDFQRSTTDAISDTSYAVTCIHLGSRSVANLAVDSAWWESPVQVNGEQSTLLYQVTNYGDEDRKNMGVTLRIDGQVKGVETIDVRGGETIRDSISFLVQGTGWQELELSVEDYPVNFDDRLYLSFRPVTRVRVTEIGFGSTDRILPGIFSNALFSFASVPAGNIDYNRLADNDLIILHELDDLSSGLQSSLEKALRAGTSLLLIPGSTMNLQAVNSFLAPMGAVALEPFSGKRQASSVNLQHAIFDGVFDRVPKNLALPFQQNGWAIKPSVRSDGESVISFADGTPMVYSMPAGSGTLYLLGTPLDQAHTDLPGQGAIFVPMIYRMALLSKGYQIPYLIAGREQWVSLAANGSAAEETVATVSGNGEEFIAAVRQLQDHTEISLYPYAREAGFYKVSADSVSKVIALNADRRESQLECLSVNELKELGNDRLAVLEGSERFVADSVLRLRDGRQLWKICVILALLALASEILLLRFLPV